MKIRNLWFKTKYVFYAIFLPRELEMAETALYLEKWEKEKDEERSRQDEERRKQNQEIIRSCGQLGSDEVAP